MRWQVNFVDNVKTQLAADLASGAINHEDLRIIKRWVVEVESLGLERTQKNKDWRDHQLDGKWKGHRAISFSYSGRVIYRVEGDRLIVMVVRVTADHEY